MITKALCGGPDAYHARAVAQRCGNATGYKTGGGCGTLTGSGWRKTSRRLGVHRASTRTIADPVVCVNWDDAKAYVAWLVKTTGKPYRLLSEAEAEYAARGVTVASTQPRYFFGDDIKNLCQHVNGADQTAKANFTSSTVAPCKDGHAFTAPAMSFKANAFGLYDVHGNAWSWVKDLAHDDYNGAPTDGSAWTSGDCSRSCSSRRFLVRHSLAPPRGVPLWREPGRTVLRLRHPARQDIKSLIRSC